MYLTGAVKNLFNQKDIRDDGMARSTQNNSQDAHKVRLRPVRRERFRNVMPSGVLLFTFYVSHFTVHGLKKRYWRAFSASC